MKYEENIQTVASLQPDYLGFIFHEKSPRNFSGKTVKIPDDIKKVGVFVNASIKVILSKTEEHHLDTIQLHGNEDVIYCNALREKLNRVEIIKVFSVDDEFDFNQLEPYEEVVDFYLFDTKGKLPGGNGFAFNWNVLNHYSSNKPYFLSGGIGLEEIQNLKEFILSKASNYCYAIDVNSKFELEPGLKNIEKLKEFKSQLP